MDAVHPGSVLRQELEARGLSANKLALALRVPSGRITQILNGKRAITPDTALRLGRYFGGAPGEWVRLQAEHDLALAERDLGARIHAEVVVAAPGTARDAAVVDPAGDRNETAPAGAPAAAAPPAATQASEPANLVEPDVAAEAPATRARAERGRRPVSRTGAPLTVRRLRGRSRR